LTGVHGFSIKQNRVENWSTAEIGGFPLLADAPGYWCTGRITQLSELKKYSIFSINSKKESRRNPNFRETI